MCHPFTFGVILKITLPFYNHMVYCIPYESDHVRNKMLFVPSSDVQYHHIDYRDIIFHIMIMIYDFHLSIYCHMCSCSNLANLIRK